MPNIYYTQPTTVTVDWGTTGDKTLLQITDNLPAGNKIVLFALGWDGSAAPAMRQYLKIVSGSTTLAQEGLAYRLGYLREPAMLFAYHANAPANAQYSFVSTVTTAATGTTTLHVQGMVVLLESSSAFFTTGINTNIAAGATVTLATATTDYPADSKVAVLAHVQIGVTSSTGGDRLYQAGNIRILRGSTIVSQNEFQVGSYSNIDLQLVDLSYFDASSGANQSYGIQVYNSLGEGSQAWGEIIVFRVGDGAFLDTGSVALTAGSQVTVGNLSTSLSGEVGVIALAAARNTGTTSSVAFNAGDVVLQLNNSATGQISNLRPWQLGRDTAFDTSGIHTFFKADTAVSNPSYQVKMTARASNINGEAKILAFVVAAGQDIKKWLAETLQLQEGVGRVVGKFRTVAESLSVSEGFARGLGKFRSVVEQLNISEVFSRARQLARAVGETVNLSEVVVRARSLARWIVESLNVSEVVARTVGRLRSVSEVVNISEVSRDLRSKFRVVGEMLNFSEAFSRARVMARMVGEGLNIVQTVSRARVLVRWMAETVGISEVAKQVKGMSLFFVEQLNISEVSKKLRDRFRSIGETMQLGESVQRARELVRLVGEQMNINEGWAVIRALTRRVGEVLHVPEFVSTARGAVRVIVEFLHVGESGRVVREVVRQVVEFVRISELPVFGKGISRFVVESVRVFEDVGFRIVRVLARLVGALTKVRGEGARA